MVLSGHVLNDGLGRLSSTNAFGQVVHQMLVNYQMQALGGEAVLRLIEFLPDGTALILQRDRGLMSHADFRAGRKIDVEGMPDMLVKDAAGAHDIELHPRYAENGWIYVAYSEGEEHRSTAVVDRVRLRNDKVTARERIFTADAYSEGLYHFASRMSFVDGYLYLALGGGFDAPATQPVAAK